MRKRLEECMTVEDMEYLNRSGVEIEVNDGRIIAVDYPEGRFEEIDGRLQ